MKKQSEIIEKKLEASKKIYNQNRDLVTKKCALQSTIDKLKYDVKDRDRRIEDLLES